MGSVLFSVKVWCLVIMGGSSSWSFDDGNTFEKDDPHHCCGDKSQQNFGRNMIMATDNHFSSLEIYIATIVTVIFIIIGAKLLGKLIMVLKKIFFESNQQRWDYDLDQQGPSVLMSTSSSTTQQGRHYCEVTEGHKSPYFGASPV